MFTAPEADIWLHLEEATDVNMCNTPRILNQQSHPKRLVSREGLIAPESMIKWKRTKRKRDLERDTLSEDVKLPKNITTATFQRTKRTANSPRTSDMKVDIFSIGEEALSSSSESELVSFDNVNTSNVSEFSSGWSMDSSTQNAERMAETDRNKQISVRKSHITALSAIL
ncbi:unnamed protein product [Schistosoma mattheei]|uniref:Uncharacterized protein n=1 Tax=Schistosoma mattheei TaxID=31246 RepID=A0A183NJL0_9TREM|nr:unnamed protein product [Schistosoma mattheei]